LLLKKESEKILDHPLGAEVKSRIFAEEIMIYFDEYNRLHRFASNLNQHV